MTTIVLTTISLTTTAQNLTRDHSKKLKISYLTDDHCIFTTYNEFKGVLYPSNGMYIVTNQGVVLIDTPWDVTQCQPLLDSIAKKHQQKVVLAIATHYHGDRTGGFDFLQKQGIKTYTSKHTYDLCKEHNEKQAEFYFTKDTTFRVGNHSFQTFYPGEGHTKDNLVIWCKNKKVLYGGCLVKSTKANELGNLADANLEGWPASIQRVIQKYPHPKYVIPGHDSWASNKSLQHTLNLLNQHRSNN